VGENPRSLRRVIPGVVAGMLLLAPSASGVPGDPTPPAITPLYSPALPANGWYRGNVTLNWAVQDPESDILETIGCGAKTFSADTPGERVTCSATSDGGTNALSVWIRLDKTVPSVAAVAERPADANGWYNRPVAVSFSGTDATSGIASCSAPTTYSSPDNFQALVAGSCTDKAGNTNGASFGFKYDATPPTLFAVTAKRANRAAELAWRKSSDTQRVEVWRAPGRGGAGESIVHQGADAGYRDTGLVVGRKYEYRIAALDDAANRSEQKLEFIATGALLSPVPAERVTSPPQLAWTPVKGASYYNVQLIRGRKVFSAWPARPGLRLRRTWTLNGRRHRLRPGAYRWYVWPGYGRIKAARYGKLLGSSTFVVAG
jgi:hypothetical protein